jgi:hypothetical protein
VCLWNVVLFCLLLVGNKIDHLFIKNIYIYIYIYGWDSRTKTQYNKHSAKKLKKKPKVYWESAK